MEREAVLEEGRNEKMLEERVPHPPRDHSLVRQPMGVLQVEQPQRCRRSHRVRREEPGPFALEALPVYQRRQVYQLMTHVDHVDQARMQEIVLFRAGGFRLHLSIWNCRVMAQILQLKGTKNTTSSNKFNALRPVQARLIEMAIETKAISI